MPHQNIPFIMWFILSCFATHRLALMVSKEDGPAWIFRKIRKVPSKKSSIHEGIQCLWCVSIWMCVPITYLSYRLFPMSWEQVIVYALAVSSGAIAINQAFTQGVAK